MQAWYRLSWGARTACKGCSLVAISGAQEAEGRSGEFDLHVLALAFGVVVV